MPRAHRGGPRDDATGGADVQTGLLSRAGGWTAERPPRFDVAGDPTSTRASNQHG